MYSDQTYELTVLPGTTRDGEKEGFDRIVIRPGDTLSIVRPTSQGNPRSSTISRSLRRRIRSRDAASLSTGRSPRKTSCATRQKSPSRS